MGQITAFPITTRRLSDVTELGPLDGLRIGTTEQDGELHIDGGTGAVSIVLEKDSGQEAMVFVHEEGTQTAHIGQDANNDIYIENDVTNKDIILKILDGAANNEVLRIDGSESRVAIGGFANPAALLELRQATTDETTLLVNNTNSGDPLLAFALNGTRTFTMGIDNSDSDKFKLGTSAPETNTRLTIDSSGNVGLCTSTPDGKLHVDGLTGDCDVILEKDAGQSCDIIFHKDGSAAGHIAFDSSDNILIENDTQDQDIVFQIDDGGTDVEMIRLDADISAVLVKDGKAGSVTADTNSDDLVVENDDDGGVSILVPDANESRLVFGAPSDNIGALVKYKHDSTLMTLGTSTSGGELAITSAVGTEAIRVDSSQNVGVGTNSPNTLLEVASSPGANTTDGPTLRLSRLGGLGVVSSEYDLGAIEWYESDPDVTGTVGKIATIIQTNSNVGPGGAVHTSLTFHTANNEVLAEQMRIDRDGQVGIGTTNPQSLLDVSSSSGPQVTLSNSNGAINDGDTLASIAFRGADNDVTESDRIVAKIVGVSERAWGSGDAGGGVAIHTGNPSSVAVTERMRVTEEGDVGINTTAPSEKVHINVDTTDAVECLELQQQDVSEGFINFVATSAANTTNPLTTFTSGNSIQGFLRIEINGTDRWVPFYSAPTS